MPPGQDEGPLTVIVPTYNRERSLPAAIASVLRQTHVAMRVLVVDDGSTDGTAAVVGAIGDPRLRLIRHDANRGAAAARNTGIRAAGTRYVAFLDSDDLWVEDKLARQLAFLAAGSSAIGCATAHYLHRDREGPPILRNAGMRPLGLPEMIRHDTLCLGSTLMVDRACFEAVGGFDESLARLEDWEWSLRFAARYQLPVLPAPLAHIFVGGRRAIGDAVAASASRIVALHALSCARHKGAARRLRATAAWHTAYGYHLAGRPARAAASAIEAVRLDPGWRLPALAFWLGERIGLARRDPIAAAASWNDIEKRMRKRDDA